MIRICTRPRTCRRAPGRSGAEVDGTPVAIVHGEDDEFYAAYDECSHAAVALSEGEVEGCTLECWLHGSRFDLRTGEPTGSARHRTRARLSRRSPPTATSTSA